MHREQKSAFLAILAIVGMVLIVFLIQAPSVKVPEVGQAYKPTTQLALEQQNPEPLKSDRLVAITDSIAEQNVNSIKFQPWPLGHQSGEQR